MIAKYFCNPNVFIQIFTMIHLKKLKRINYNISEIFNKFLLVGAKFMCEIHLRQAEFIYSAFGPFTKNKERLEKCKEMRDLRCIYQNQLDKACFQHDMANEDFKDLSRRTASDKVLHDSI